MLTRLLPKCKGRVYNVKTMAVLQLNEQEVQAFIQATVSTFQSMVNLKIVPGETRLKEGGELHHEVTGMITLSGDREGSLTLGFSKALAYAIARAFLGEKDVSAGLMASTIGELANIVSGFAKQGMEDLDLKLSLPTVVFGEAHEIFSPVEDRKVVAPFDSEAGKFHLVICLERST